VVSHLTPAPAEAQIKGLTFATNTAEDRQKTRASWDWRDLAASGVVMVAIIFAYVYFTG
jgi:SSS family solute:Na+ symporter